MNKQASKLQCTLLFFAATIGGVLFGFDLGIISGAIIFINRDIYMTVNENSLLVSAIFIGSTLSILIGGLLADLFGRKLLILFSALIFIVSVIIIVQAHNFEILFLGRMIQGIAVGIMIIVAPLYLTESLPTELRGSGVTIFQLLLTFGILSSSIVALYFTEHGGNWRAMFYTALIPAVLMFTTSFVLPESPRWLAMKGKYDKALNILLKTRTEVQAKKDIQQMQHHLLNLQNNKLSLTKIMQRQYLLPLVIVLSIAILQQTTGINAILQLSTTILHQSGFISSTNAVFGTLLITGLNFITTIIAYIIVDKYERKHLVLFGLAGIIMISLYNGIIFYLFPIGTHVSSRLLLSGILIFIYFYAIGPGAVIWVILTELLPLKIRSMGFACALFFNSLTSALVSGLFIKVSNTMLGYAGVFWLTAGATCIYFIIVLFYIPHISGKSLEEIEDIFIAH